MQTAFFNRKGSIPQISYAPDLMSALFKLNEGKRYPDDVYENKNGSFVFRWEAYKGIAEETYQKEKENLRLTMMQEKQTQFFEGWLEALRGGADIETFITP